MVETTHDFAFEFTGKKIGHKFQPAKYTARMLRTRINQAGNLEIVLTDVRQAESARKES